MLFDPILKAIVANMIDQSKQVLSSIHDPFCNGWGDEHSAKLALIA